MSNYAIMSDELYHHGIKGQKWGVRRFQNPDGTRTAAGKKRYYENSNSKSNKEESKNSSKPTSESVSKKKKLNTIFNHKIGSVEQNEEGRGFKGLSPKTKKILIGVGATAAVAAIAYTAYRINEKYPRLNSFQYEIDFNKKNNPFSAIKKISAPEDKRTAMSKINPDYGKPGTSMNCSLCTTAYEMRMRGYDVQANRSRLGRKRTDISLFFKNTSSIDWEDVKIDPRDKNKTKESFNSLFNQMPDGSRGNICAKVGPFDFKHSMVWEKEGDKITIRDCQTNKVYDYKNLFYEPGSNGIIRLDKAITFLRTDDREIHPDRIMDAIRPSGKKFPKFYDKIFKEEDN